jgi:hypothetical protein
MELIKQCFLVSKDSELNADLMGDVRVIVKGGESIIRGKKVVTQSVITSYI